MKKYYCLLGIVLIVISLAIGIRSYKSNESLKTTLTEIRDDYLFIINEQKKNIDRQEKVIHALNIELFRKQMVTISFYHPPSKGINSDSDPTNTATMTRPIVGRTVAISNDLFKAGWLGWKIYIEGFGVFICEDRMGSKVEGKQIDICVSSEKKAFKLGKKYNVIAIRIG